MRPTMTTTYQPTTHKRSFDFGGAASTLIRFGIIAGVVLTVGYFALDSLGVFDLTWGETVTNIQDRQADERAVMDMLRNN